MSIVKQGDSEGDSERVRVMFGLGRTKPLRKNEIARIAEKVGRDFVPRRLIVGVVGEIAADFEIMRIVVDGVDLLPSPLPAAMFSPISVHMHAIDFSPIKAGTEVALFVRKRRAGKLAAVTAVLLGEAAQSLSVKTVKKLVKKVAKKSAKKSTKKAARKPSKKIRRKS
jgi:hypothetical protein